MWSWVTICLCPLMTFLTSGETMETTTEPPLATPPAARVSAPEDHRLYLLCGARGDVVWTHRVWGVVASKRGGETTCRDPQKYALMADGSLSIDELEAPDAGEYRCNGRLVADVRVLTGQPYVVSAGQVLLLPCRGSTKPKQRWFFRGEGLTRRQPIATRYKNGTVRKERADPGGRFSYRHDALQILRLQPGDAGEYLCNSGTVVRVTVLEANPDHSSTQTTTLTPVMKTDAVEKENKEQTHGNVLLMVAVIGLCATVVLTGLMCLLVTGGKCRKKGKYGNGGTELRVEDTELQIWSSLPSTACETSASDRDTTVPQMEELHYASLGRQNWRDRPRALGDQQHSHVIYSSVCTRPRDTTTTT